MKQKNGNSNSNISCVQMRSLGEEQGEWPRAPRLPRYLQAWNVGNCWGPAVVNFCASFQVDSVFLVGLDVQSFKEFSLMPVGLRGDDFG